MSHVNYKLHISEDLADALEMMAAAPGQWLPMAGGTDLMVVIGSGTLPSMNLLALWKIAALRKIEFCDRTLSIGACATYSDIRMNPLIREKFPLLIHAAAATGAIAIQNKGTIGGNIANASPAADTPPALLAYDADIELVSKRGTRTVKYDSFHTGYKKTIREPDELIHRITLRECSSPTQNSIYRKVGTRTAQAISKVVFAATAGISEKETLAQIRLAFGSMGPTPIRAKKTENLLKGQMLGKLPIDDAIATLGGELTPIDDIRSTREYRRKVAGNLLKHFLGEIAESKSSTSSR